jgi:hypothetical protein
MAKVDGYGVGELANSFQDLLRRGQLERESIDRLESELRELAADEWDRQTRETFFRRVTGLAPLARSPTKTIGRRIPYLELLRSDKSLKAAVTQKKKKTFLGL